LAHSNNKLTIRKHVTKDIFLSKGEQVELRVGVIKSFSVGNPEVIKYKHRIPKKSILIKGKSLGFSDIVVWNNLSTKVTYNLYVTSKKEQLSTMNIAQSLKRTKLKVRIHGKYIHISGILSNLSDYIIFKKLEAKKDEALIFDVSLGKNLRNEIISNIYTNLYDQEIESVICRSVSTQITCLYQENINGSPDLLQMKSKYYVSFKSMKFLNLTKNFVLSFKIIAINNYLALNKTFGVNKFEAKLHDLVSNNVFAPTSNEILFQDQKSKITLVAQPSISMTIDSPFNIQLGGDIPFQTTQNDTSKIEWKFAGLKVSGLMKLKFNSYFLKYKTMFTSPVDGSMTGPKGNSTTFLEVDKLQQVFSIDLKENSTNMNSIPLLNKIPLFKKLFEEELNKQGHRKILGFIMLTEKKNDR
jgi:hypothetical protein